MSRHSLTCGRGPAGEPPEWRSPALNPIRLVLVVPLILSSAAAFAVDLPDSVELTGEAGKEVHLSVVVEKAANLGAFEFEAIFDPEILDVKEVGLADFLGSTGRKVLPIGPRSRQPGSISFGASTLGGGEIPGPTGDGILAVVTVTFKKDGISPFRLARYQTTDPQGNLTGFALAIKTDVAVKRLLEPEAERFVLALPGSPAEVRQVSVMAAVQKLRETVGEGREGNLPKALPVAHINPANKETESDGTLILIDDPEYLEKAARILGGQNTGQPLRQSLWSSDREVGMAYEQGLREAGLSENLQQRFRESVESGKHVALGFRLVLSSPDGGTLDEAAKTLLGIEMKRIQEDAHAVQAVAIGLPASGTLLAITPIENVRALEQNVLHTLAAGSPDDWRLLAIEQESLLVRDGEGYLHMMKSGSDPSGYEVTELNPETGLARVRDRVSLDEYELKIVPWEAFHKPTD